MQHTTCHLKQSEWLYIASLMKCGYPLLDALKLLHMDIACIQTQLEEGKDILAILTKNATGQFYEHLHFFLQIMCLEDAIESSASMCDFEKQMKAKLLKKSAYPIFIMLLSYVLLFFFTAFIIPTMMVSFEADQSFQLLSMVVGIIQIVCILFAGIVCLLLAICIYLQFHIALRSALLLKRKTLFSITRDYESYLFAGYMVQMEKHGISTRHSMHFLADVQKDTLFSHLMKRMKKQLEQGVEFQSMIDGSGVLNEDFKLAFRIGCAASTLEVTLSHYLKQQELQWERKIKKISIAIQAVSYMFVGFVVMIVYQIMLVPLQMLETM